MGFELRAGTRSRSGAAAWAGPARAPPRDPAARVDPPRGSARARADADAEARSKYARKKTTHLTSEASVDATGETRVFGTRTNAAPRRDTRQRRVPDPPTRWTPSDVSDAERKVSSFLVSTARAEPPPPPDSDPVLVETAAPGFADQGVAKTDVVVDEDGDAANDFILADPDPDISRSAPTSARRDEGEDSRGGPSQTSPSLFQQKKTHSVRACASCALDVSAQPDVPLPALAKDDPPRPDTEVGRWLGWCEDGCAVALCGPCATASVTPVLAAATTHLEAVVSGLGTGYTALGEDDDPEGAAARDPPVRCPCVRVGKGKRGGLGGGAEREQKGARRCASRLLAPPFAEAERETHQTWAMAATEALFAARDSRMFASSPGLSDPPGGASIAISDSAGGSPPRGGIPRGDPVDADATDPRQTDDAAEEETAARERFAICPNFSCAARVLLEPPPPPRNGGADLVAERDPTTSRWLSREALIHRHTKRFRCARCASDFCGDCLATPYHVGFHLCAAAAAAAAAPRCRYCDAPHLDPGTHYFRSADIYQRGVAGDASVRELRRLIGDVDTAWCVTKDDLRAVHALASSVCALPACRAKVEAACSKTLACGHPCGGVRGEPECLPCLRCPKAEAAADGEISSSLRASSREVRPDASHRAPFPSGTEPCCVCYADELKAEPCIRLGCGHVLHSRCALERIKNGWPTQNITFEHLRCPLCGEDGREPTARGSMQAAVMSHPSLARALAPALALRETVMRRARRRLALDANGPPRQIQAGGDYEGRPGEFALSRFNYYLCETCETPYFGGDRACHRGGVERGDAPGQAPAAGPEAHRLVCGSCSVTSRGKACTKGHGAEEMEYKCRYCCGVAVWFCFGTTHFCDACHTRWVTSAPDWETDPPMKACTRKTCPLRVEHPEHGQEFCLGCAVCRSLKASQQD